MPRSFTQVYCSIWDDEQFCKLTAGAQRTYLLLITQGDITACGSLPLTLRRWARTCVDSELEVWLAELTDAGFVLIDEDTEELFVRTFAKHDGGYTHAVRRKAVVSTARAIKSPLLKSTAVDELGKLGLSIVTADPPLRDRSGTTEEPESVRIQGTEGEYVPETGTGNLERGTAATVVAAPPSMYCQKHPNGTEEPCGPCGTARLAYKAWCDEKLEADVARRAAAEARRTQAALNEMAEAKANAVPLSVVGRGKTA